MTIHWRKVGLFILLAYVISWAIIGVYVANGGTLKQPWAIAVLILYMFGPAAAAVIVQKFIYKDEVMRPLRVSFRLNKWFLVAWVLPPLLGLATFGVLLLLPGVSYATPRLALPPGTPPWLANPLIIALLSMVSGMIAGVTVNAIAAFGEELGWRGLLLRELAPLGFWRLCLIIGVLWGLWHAPVILMGYNYPQHPRIGVLLMVVWTLLLTPLLCYVTLRAKSVIAAAVYHGTLNGTYALGALLATGYSDLTGVLGLAGFITLLVANALLVMYDRYLSHDPLLGKSGAALLGSEATTS